MILLLLMVGEMGLEPIIRFREADFKSAAYTNSATRPRFYFTLFCGGAYQSCTGLGGFADLCVTAPPTHHSCIITKTPR